MNKDLQSNPPSRRSTRSSGDRRISHIILRVLVACALVGPSVFTGCSTGGRYAPAKDRTPLPAPHEPTTSNASIKAAAAVELGPDAAAAIPASQRALPLPPEPGAQAIVNSMLATMGDRVTGGDGITRIGMNQVRNQSHATPAEFAAFQHRFAGLLNEAGRESRMHFTDEPDAAVEYQMQGAAYVVVIEGMDAWELFLSVSRADRAMAVWQAGGALHVMRQPRAGMPQILPLGR